MARINERVAFVEFVTWEFSAPFDQVKEFFEAAIPHVGEIDALKLAQRDLKGDKAPLAIVSSYDRSTICALAGQARQAIQYEITSPSATLRMVRGHMPALMYLPFKVLLLETEDGQVAVEYNKPSSVLKHFRDGATKALAKELDNALTAVLQEVSHARSTLQIAASSMGLARSRSNGGSRMPDAAGARSNS
jgi:uncharacterized protein (DUF302 family)